VLLEEENKDQAFYFSAVYMPFSLLLWKREKVFAFLHEHRSDLEKSARGHHIDKREKCKKGLWVSLIHLRCLSV